MHVTTSFQIGLLVTACVFGGALAGMFLGRLLPPHHLGDDTKSVVTLASGTLSVPRPFLAVLVFWLTILFTGFGLFAPRHATVVAALLVCALSLSAAIFLILEMDRPFEGFIIVSPAAMQTAEEL